MNSQFDVVVSAYAKDLYRYAYWLCKNSHDAEDLVQQTFIKAWKSWSTLRNKGAEKSWLFVILRNEFYDMVRKNKLHDVSIDDCHDLADNSIDPAEHLSLYQGLNQLPISLTEPLLLQFIGGFSTEEIASLLDTSVGAICTRLTRARTALKEQLSQEGATLNPSTLRKLS